MSYRKVLILGPPARVNPVLTLVLFPNQRKISSTGSGIFFGFSKGKEGRTVQIWKLHDRYEDHLRKALGESKYQELCQKFPNVGKPTRARLIAMEPGLVIRMVVVG